MEVKEEMKKFYCNYREFLRCGFEIYRSNVGDFFDYPYCEYCQEKDDPIHGVTRLDNGGYPELL